MSNLETNLLSAVAKKNAKALEKIYDLYSPLLFTIIKRVLNDENLSIKVLSEVFAILWLKADTLINSKSSLYLILVNLARNKALDTKNRNEKLISEPYDDAYENNYILPQIFCNEELNIEFLQSEQETIQLLFSNLTEAQLYVLNISYFEGKTLEELSKTLKLPQDTIFDKIKVAFSNLKENLIIAGF